MRAVVAISVLLLVGGTAIAGGKKEADRHFAKGMRLEGEGDFEAALTEFGAAQAAWPTAETMLHIAECQEALGETLPAIASYQRYLDDVEGTPEAEPIRKHIGDLQAKLHVEKAQQLKQERRWADAIEEFEAALRARPAPHLYYEIAVCYEDKGNNLRALENYRRYLKEKPDASDAGEIEGRIAVLSGRKLSPPPPSLTETPRKPKYMQSPWYTSGAGWGLTVMALLLGGTGGTLYGLSTVAARDLDRASNEADWLATRDRGVLLNQAGIGLMAAGGAALVTGIVLFMVHTRPRVVEEKPEPKPANVDPFAPRSLGGGW